MVNFEFQCATKMIFGKGTEEKVGEELKAYGATRVLFVYGGSSIKRSGLYDRVVKSLKDAGLWFTELPGVVPTRVSRSCARVSRSAGKKRSISCWLSAEGVSLIRVSRWALAFIMMGMCGI